jgi:phage terminase Nu1 subunit (DNA packaging protein)
MGVSASLENPEILEWGTCMTAYDPDIEAVLGGSPEPADADTVSADEVGAWLGVNGTQVHRLARQGVIPRTDDKRFDLRAAILAYATHLRDARQGRTTTDPELNAEKLRLARANAEKIELANAKTRAALVPVADVEAAWASVLRDVRAAMLAIPARVQQRLGHLTAHDVQMIDREVRDALEEASHER